jgi:hypothetical protein
MENIVRRFLILITVVLFFGAMPAANSHSQELTIPQPGDPPVAALIHISPPNGQGRVTISGDPGAVWRSGEVAIQNLYTGESVYAYSGVNGIFLIDIPASGSTPFWISPVEFIPGSERYQPGAPPGGPGTIIIGPPAEEVAPLLPVTQIRVDGELDDWRDYVSAQLSTEIYALMNTDSLTLATYMDVPGNAQLVSVFSIDAVTYEFAFTPALPQTALLRQIAPGVLDLGTRAVYVANGDGIIEFRFPLDGLPGGQTVTLKSLFTRPYQESENQDNLRLIEATIPVYDEQDGLVSSGDVLGLDSTRFSVAGPIAQGASTWQAEGRINNPNPMLGEMVTIEMDVTLHAPDLGESLTGLDLVGEISLQPVESAGRGHDPVVVSPVAVSTIVPAAQTVRRGDDLLARLRFEIPVAPDFIPGLYVPVFRGRAKIGDSDRFDWTDNGIFGVGDGLARLPVTRLPVVLNVGDVADTQLNWALLYNTSSDGSRGVWPEASQGRWALANRVRFDSAGTILPPGAYPIEPYLLSMLSNTNDVTVAPLLPFQFPNGSLQATITRPDGTVDALPQMPILQNRIDNDETLFGAQLPQNIYRLTTLDPVYTAYSFDLYGEYTVQLTGSLDDVQGNHTTGGGTYHITIAEPLDFTPGVLCGAPFHVGDALFIGGQVAPAFPADMTVHLRFTPLTGDEIIEGDFTAIANPHGIFALVGEGFVFDQPGEYRLDYDAQVAGIDGRLWAGRLRCVGVVANPQSALVAHGQRGLPTLGDYPDLYRPAWFNMIQYPPPEMNLSVPERLYFPYFAGDIAVLTDNAGSGMQPVLTVQDLGGDYTNRLLSTMPDAVSASGLSLDEMALTDGLPVLSEWDENNRVYFSAVRPDVSVRQFVLGLDDAGLTTYWENDDPLNGQIGAGVDGLRSGDTVFLFGGAVVRISDDVRDAIAYAALAVVKDAHTPAGVYAAYSDVSLLPDADVTSYFHPTGIKPGQVLTIGDSLAVAGQIAPTLPSTVTVTITAPSGAVRQFTALTSPTGYLYNPNNDFVVDEVGLWTVQILTTPAGLSSVGEIGLPLPVGGVPGVVDGRFSITVLPEGAAPLAIVQSDGSANDGVLIANISPGLPVNVTVLSPPDWTNVQAHTTVRTESTVLETGSIPVGDGVGMFTATYNPGVLSQRFPNLETDGQGRGVSGADVVTLTVTMTGIDANGQFAVRARIVTILNDRLESAG